MLMIEGSTSSNSKNNNWGSRAHKTAQWSQKLRSILRGGFVNELEAIF